MRASQNISEGIVVAKFEGSIAQEPGSHSKWVGRDSNNKDKFINVESSAVYVNHSCEPNCIVSTTDWTVHTKRTIQKGEALTISYNKKDDFPENLEWDPKWNFNCYCGADICLQKITGWQI